MNGCGVVELRRYTLHPGMRDTLIELFERKFVETQEAVGIDVLGTFTDVDAPDSFVWLRGFADMRTRGAALQAFYGGPVWAEHGNAANATMIDSDDVLLLRPLDQTSRLALDRARRPPPGARRARAGALTVTVCPLEPTQADKFRMFFEDEIEPRLREDGANVRARFATEHSPNDYPALPIREGEEVFVWLSLFADDGARDDHAARTDLGTLVGGELTGEPETYRLTPTARSLLPD
jgi:NIPSNAP